MIREPLPHRAPAVLGRDEPLRLSDGALRFLLLGAVILAAGVILALALLPATRAMANATLRFTGQFTELAPGDLSFPRFPERSTILARDGRTVLATLYLDENRKVVRLDEIAPVARQAVVAIEDDGFYQHGALDVEGILRAAFRNIQAGEITEGGSTITQQLVKTVFTSGERTFARKIEEARLAFRLEREYTKDQILELYLNEVYLGRSVNGIQAAAEFYFAKDAKDLTLPESALLAGLIAAPEDYNPITQRERSLERRNHVLNRMRDLGMITESEAEAAKAAPIKLSTAERTTNRPGKAAYFVEYIRSAILDDPTFGRTKAERRHALYQGGLRIVTTLEPEWLKFAKDAVKSQLPLPEDPESAVVTIDSENGAIRTLLGGTDFEAQKFDLATQGLRQPGSAFKAFTLVAALEQGIPRGKVYNMQSPTVIPDPICAGPDGLWDVSNAEGGSENRFINMDYATAHSVNVYFAQLIVDTGPGAVMDAAERMGVRSELAPICSLTLGGKEVTPLDMASGYATLANDGMYCEPYAIAEVIGPNDELVYRHRPKCTQAVEPDIVATVSEMLQGVVRDGTGTGANIGRPMAGKTGTTDKHSDGWFVGYLHKQLSTAVWVGDIRGAIPIESRGSISGPLFGGNKPASIWREYMSRTTEGMEVTTFPSPPPIPDAEVPKVVGLTVEEAERVLGEANFTAVVKERAANAPAGVVVAQAPSAGASVTAGSAVTIFVSTGEAPNRIVPNVIGDHRDAAISRLHARQFNVEISYVNVNQQSQHEIVQNQLPRGGTKMKEGSTVRIVVGNYDPPDPSPSPTCDANDKPKCDGPGNDAAGGTATAAGAAWVVLPLLLAAGARRRSVRRGG